MGQVGVAMAFLQFPQLLFVFGYFPWVVYVRHGLIVPLMNGNCIRNHPEFRQLF